MYPMTRICSQCCFNAQPYQGPGAWRRDPSLWIQMDSGAHEARGGEVK